MKLFTSLLPLMPQPYKNIVKFFLATLKNVDEKEELLCLLYLIQIFD